MTITSVRFSSLSKEDTRLFKMDWEDYRSPFVDKFVQDNFDQILNTWVEGQKQGYGVVEITALYPMFSDGNWTYRFKLFSELTDDPNLLAVLNSPSGNEVDSGLE